MKVSNFDFYLPEKLIAQEPLKDRTASKLLVVNVPSKTILDKEFRNITSFLDKGDVIVRNNTRVISARIFGMKEETGAKVEVLLLEQISKDTWECLVGNAKVIKQSTKIFFNEDLKAKCISVKDDGIRILKFIYKGDFLNIINKFGETPLPPYIKKKLEDSEKYQTTYSKNLGSSAAPTAGLHFTKEIFKELKRKGVIILDITLNIGLGTFKPVNVDLIQEFKIHEEKYSISKKTARILNKSIKQKKNIIALGTTTVRALETNFRNYNKIKAVTEKSDIFIYPGYEFNVIDAMITNFHLPKSTLLMMVSAFASKELMMKAYEHSVNKEYRFFSFGDCMLIDNRR